MKRFGSFTKMFDSLTLPLKKTLTELHDLFSSTNPPAVGNVLEKNEVPKTLTPVFATLGKITAERGVIQ